METRIVKALRDKRGEIGSTILCMVLLLVLVCAISVIGRVFTIRQNVTAEIERALTTSVALTMQDSHRKDHSSNIDTTDTENDIYSYLRSDLGLNGDLAKVVKGTEEYRITIYSLTFNDTVPPRATAEGQMHIPIKVASSFGIETTLTLPFRISSKNQRLDWMWNEASADATV